ncbi:tRNA methyltransferase tyw3 [Actinomortierella wolfii]|nr:tRNA methyltransferase tyw3 [Actinomortierella wolfii]
MVIALLPNNNGLLPPVDQPSSLLSIQEQLQDLNQWPTDLNDPLILQSCFLIWTSESSFATPRHLLTQTPQARLRQLMTEFLTPVLATLDEPSSIDLQQLLYSLPQKWEHYSGFTLLPPNSFLVDPWPKILEHLMDLDAQKSSTQQQQQPAATETSSKMKQLEAILLDALQSTHIARKAIIPVQDLLRRPKIRPLAGDWGIHNKYKTFVERKDAHLIEHPNVPTLPTATASVELSSPAMEAMQDSAKLAREEELDFKGAYWAMTSQNHVWYSWVPMFTMFSAGNITEKERIAHARPIFDAQDKVVVDLYAGIGYFTLVYLVHAGARLVHACEWNPWSVEGLCRGAAKNGIEWEITQDHTQIISAPSLTEPITTATLSHEHQHQQPQLTSSSPSPSSTTATHNRRTTFKPKPRLGRLQIYPGDNSQWIQCFENTAHHVNLGLIPSAEQGWVLGVRALCPKEGGFLHVHHNVRQGDEAAFEALLLKELQSLFRTWKTSEQDWTLTIRHVECVKSFAPMVYHNVYDVECRPPK